MDATEAKRLSEEANRLKAVERLTKTQIEHFNKPKKAAEQRPSNLAEMLKRIKEYASDGQTSAPFWMLNDIEEQYLIEDLKSLGYVMTWYDFQGSDESPVEKRCQANW